MGAHEDTGLQMNLFEPFSERGTFSNWAKYGDIPSTHGDIPVVFCLVYEIGFLATKGFFKISTHGEHNFGCFKFRACRFQNLYVLYVRILSRREKIIYFGIQYNSAIQLLLISHFQSLGFTHTQYNSDVQ